MAKGEGSDPEKTGVEALFDAPPSVEVRTSAAAVAAFICGWEALLAAPFSLTASLALFLAAVGFVAGMVGLATTNRPHVAGRALAPVGLFLCLLVLLWVGLRYVSVDTSFGDGLAPALADLLERLNERMRLT